MCKLLDSLCGNRYITGSISSNEKSLLAKSVLHGNRRVYSTVSHSVINTFVLYGHNKMDAPGYVHSPVLLQVDSVNSGGIFWWWRSISGVTCAENTSFRLQMASVAWVLV